MVFSRCEGADLDEVVGEDAVSAPGSRTLDAGQFGAVPAEASFEVVDSSMCEVERVACEILRVCPLT